jgi:hypothetical protein
MKKYFVWMPLILMAVFGLAVAPTKAQSPHGVRAQVPFDFIVGNKTLSAGKIIIQRMTSGEAGPLQISNLKDGQLALRMGRKMTSTDASDHGKLVFRRYGNRHYLAEVWIPGHKAIEVIKSSNERSLQNELRLAKNYKPNLVTVFALID